MVSAAFNLQANVAGPSWSSRLVNILLRLLPFKKQWASAAAVQARLDRLALWPASHEPAGLRRGITVTMQNGTGWPVYHTAPSASAAVANHVLFLHGGGYINEIVPAHWRLVGYLTRHAHAHCVVPIYPLAPRGTAKDVVPATAEMVRKLLDTVGPDNVTLVGNSAGAGLTLAAAQWLRDSGASQPRAMVLISPWLDASISRKEQPALAALDLMQDIPGLIAAGRLYAGDLDVAHPFVSPLNGELAGLAPMIVFTGTCDLMHPDSIELAAKARAARVPIELHVRRGLPHNYPLLPTREGRQARAILARAIANRPA